MTEPAGLEFRQVSAEFAEQMHDLELRCFPNVEPSELLSVEGARLQAELFPEGAFVALDGDRVVGMGAGIFIDYDISEPQHGLEEVTGHLGVEKHDPDGDWYYGTDIAVDPGYRRRGIARRLYELRKEVVIRHGKRGIIAGGVIPGYADHKDSMSAQEYVDAVARGELVDPTLTAQIKNGFVVRGVIEGYLTDPTVDDYASFIIWFNPEHPANAKEIDG